jgi:hypothetical protein
MNANQRRTLEAFQRAQRFVATLPEPGPTPAEGEPTPPGGSATSSLALGRTMLTQVVDRLTQLAVAQDFTVRRVQEDTRRKVVLEAELRTLHMRPITQIARALLRDVAGIDQALRLPKPGSPTSVLVHAAEGMAQAAEPHERVFVRHGLPSDFLARLRAAAGVVAGLVTSRAEQRGQRVGATAGMRDEIRRGRTAVEVLDAVVSVLLADEPRRLAEWRSVKRVVAGTGGGVVKGVGLTPALSVTVGGSVATTVTGVSATTGGSQAA